jgi:hypothetical protein
MSGVVYFVECSLSSRIRIGTTIDPTQRVQQLNTFNCAPVRLVGTLSGGTVIEKFVHDRFNHLRLHGDWFQPAPELWAFIEDINHGRFLPEAVPTRGERRKVERPDEVEEASRMLMSIGAAAPSHRSKHQIDHAATECGFSRTRTQDLWYAKARQVTASEMDTIRRVAERARSLGYGA